MISVVRLKLKRIAPLEEHFVRGPRGSRSAPLERNMNFEFPKRKNSKEGGSYDYRGIT
jgi:hypothetical protein